MLILISPAKTLDTNSEVKTKISSVPIFLKQSEQIVSVLKKKNTKVISKLMSISQKLGQLNYERFQQWDRANSKDTRRQAIFMFNGDVYEGLKIQEFSESEILYAQNHLRILSGLYGILRPLDVIQPYRLEMGTKITVNRKKNLYEFWKKQIIGSLNRSIEEQGDNVLINLASSEYFSAIDKSKLKAKIITPVFKDFSNGEYKVISFFAKKTRGMMCRFILKNKITEIEKLKLFEEEGYFYNETISSESQLLFTRN
jgi:cytoplasmic iron level regulating protein YaaA (DUF328/UPF0246 family)